MDTLKEPVVQTATDLTREQMLVRDTVHEFATKHVAPGATERDRSGSFPYHLIDQMAPLGLMGLLHETTYGGGEVDTVSFCLAIEELARWDASLALIVASHTSLGSGHIALAGTHEQKLTWLAPLARGDKLAGWCLTEPEAGSDASRMQTTATADGDHWVINGSKMFITQGSVGDTFVVIARTGSRNGKPALSAFIVEGDTPGLKRGEPLKKLGMHCSDTAALHFDHVRVPKENLLGREGDAFSDCMKVLDGGRIGIAALSVGIARAAFEESLHRSLKREQFGRPIGTFQAIEHKLVEMSVEIEATRLLIHRAAQLRDSGRPYTKEASMAKLKASELAVSATGEAIQIHGGCGYLKEYPVERYWRDARLMTIGEGTSEIQKMVIARELRKEYEM